MRVKSFILGCVLLSTASCAAPPEDRVTPRCFNPVCLIATALLEQLAECLIKGGCWRSETRPIPPSADSRRNPPADQTPSRPTSEKKGPRLLICREVLVCRAHTRREPDDCFWREECRRQR
jgi:hypothetical protein